VSRSPGSRAYSANDSLSIREPRDVVPRTSCPDRSRGRLQQGQVRSPRRRPGWFPTHARRSRRRDPRYRRGRDRSHGPDRGRTVVRAPFAGVVGRRLVSIGTFVSNQTPLTSLQSVNPQHASFQVPERYVDQLRRGQLVSFQVAALPGRNFSGEVVFVDPVVELPGRTILIKARVPNPEHQLQAGMFIEARLATNIRPNAIVVPED